MDSLFVPALQPALKHRTVFQKFDALEPGQSFLLINDHDPIPLFYEMKAERGDLFDWKKIEDGPEVWRVEITRTGLAGNTAAMEEPAGFAEENLPLLNVTLIEPRLKHPTIFRQFDELANGAAFRILNDHDPKPLYYQMIAERGHVFTWQYIEKGPIWWRVEIRKNEAGNSETVGQIAAKDLRKAEVFKKYGIDFCCGGKKTLQQACHEKGLDTALVEAALDAAQQQSKPGHQFDQWEPDFLSDYIYNQHHRYYYNERSVLRDLLDKVVARHGSHYPELLAVNTLYTQLAEELDEHFKKEEEILFPFIKAAVQASKTGDTESFYEMFSIVQPIQMMESDHEAAGGILAGIRKATHDYQTPDGACNSYQFLYKKLEELETDLHQHIHLENNILFPKALRLEKQLRK